LEEDLLTKEKSTLPSCGKKRKVKKEKNGGKRVERRLNCGRRKEKRGEAFS